MEAVLLGFAMVLIIEGLAYALAPSLVERMLEAMRTLPMDARRLIGIISITAGVAMLWILKSF